MTLPELLPPSPTTGPTEVVVTASRDGKWWRSRAPQTITVRTESEPETRLTQEPS